MITMSTTDEKNRTAAQLQEELDQELAEIENLIQHLPNSKSILQRREIWPSLEETLQKSGWTSERSIDVSAIAKELSSLGVDFHEFARKFISSYNNLTVHFPRKNINKSHTYKFDALFSADHYVEFRLEEDQSIIQHHLCPIGVDNYGMVVLLIDDIGRIFASIDRKLHFVANTIQDALEKLNRDERFQPIDE